jgi:hypothetical protein
MEERSSQDGAVWGKQEMERAELSTDLREVKGNISLK